MLSDILNLVAKAKEAFKGQRLREGQDILTDPKQVLDAAKGVNNRQAGDAASVQEGDIIIFPITTKELEDRLIPQKFGTGQDDYSIGILCPIYRKGRVVMQRIFPGLFNRANEEIDPTTGKGAGTFIYPQGQPAEDFRSFYGSMYDTWDSFRGKCVKVKIRKQIEVWGLKRGAKFDTETRTFADADHQKRNAYQTTFEYASLSDVERMLGFSLSSTEAPANSAPAQPQPQQPEQQPEQQQG